MQIYANFFGICENSKEFMQIFTEFMQIFTEFMQIFVEFVKIFAEFMQIFAEFELISDRSFIEYANVLIFI